jgi:protease II
MPKSADQPAQIQKGGIEMIGQYVELTTKKNQRSTLFASNGDVIHQGGNFFILTNDNARNFRLMKAPVANPSKDNWQEVIQHSDLVRLDAVEAFENHLVIFGREARSAVGDRQVPHKASHCFHHRGLGAPHRLLR